MPEQMTCFACEQEPTQQCPRCGRPYCDEHGEEVCDACLEPASGLPSFTLYRGSLLALLIGTALAVWLILQPPGDSVDSAVAPQVITPTPPAVIETTATLPAGAPTVTTPIVQETPLASPTQGAGAANTPSPDGTVEHTIAAGDTLFGICSELSSLDPNECVDRVVELNSIDINGSLNIGDTLTVPQ
jgi:hypothetical protein